MIWVYDIDNEDGTLAFTDEGVQEVRLLLAEHHRITRVALTGRVHLLNAYPRNGACEIPRPRGPGVASCLGAGTGFEPVTFRL